MTATQKSLLALADAILLKAGYATDGRLKEEKKGTSSVRTVYTPVGGQPRKKVYA